jgi:S-formylglutathione hydrolase FrmB
VGVSRRSVILGSAVLGTAAGVGGWGLLANARLVPGRSTVDNLLGRCDVPGDPPPEAEPGILVKASFYSTHRARSVGYALAYPPGAKAGARLPVCLVLHGFGDDFRSPFDGLHYHRLLAAAVPSGVPPFVLASIDGGQAWWHPRSSGPAPGSASAADDPLAMLLSDFPPVLAQHGLPSTTLAVLGYSMGGYGAMLLAAQAPKRFVAVAASSPALWLSYDDAHGANPGAFDSADDWRRWGDPHTFLGNLRGVPLRIDCGESDSFAPAISKIQFPDPASVHISQGCHEYAYWRSAAPAQLRFLGEALTPHKTT